MESSTLHDSAKDLNATSLRRLVDCFVVLQGSVEDLTLKVKKLENRPIESAAGLDVQALVRKEVESLLMGHDILHIKDIATEVQKLKLEKNSINEEMKRIRLHQESILRQTRGAVSVSSEAIRDSEMARVEANYSAAQLRQQIQMEQARSPVEIEEMKESLMEALKSNVEENKLQLENERFALHEWLNDQKAKLSAEVLQEVTAVNYSHHAVISGLQDEIKEVRVDIAQDKSDGRRDLAALREDMSLSEERLHEFLSSKVNSVSATVGEMRTLAEDLVDQFDGVKRNVHSIRAEMQLLEQRSTGVETHLREVSGESQGRMGAMENSISCLEQQVNTFEGVLQAGKRWESRYDHMQQEFRQSYQALQVELDSTCEGRSRKLHSEIEEDLLKLKHECNTALVQAVSSMQHEQEHLRDALNVAVDSTQKNILHLQHSNESALHELEYRLRESLSAIQSETGTLKDKLVQVPITLHEAIFRTASEWSNKLSAAMQEYQNGQSKQDEKWEEQSKAWREEAERSEKGRMQKVGELRDVISELNALVTRQEARLTEVKHHGSEVDEKLRYQHSLLQEQGSRLDGVLGQLSQSEDALRKLKHAATSWRSQNALSERQMQDIKEELAGSKMEMTATSQHWEQFLTEMSANLQREVSSEIQLSEKNLRGEVALILSRVDEAEKLLQPQHMAELTGKVATFTRSVEGMERKFVEVASRSASSEEKQLSLERYVRENLSKMSEMWRTGQPEQNVRLDPRGLPGFSPAAERKYTPRLSMAFAIGSDTAEREREREKNLSRSVTPSGMRRPWRSPSPHPFN